MPSTSASIHIYSVYMIYHIHVLYIVYDKHLLIVIQSYMQRAIELYVQGDHSSEKKIQQVFSEKYSRFLIKKYRRFYENIGELRSHTSIFMKIYVEESGAPYATEHLEPWHFLTKLRNIFCKDCDANVTLLVNKYDTNYRSDIL